MIEFISQIISGLMAFLFYYPLFMSYLWMIGAIYYYLHWEKVEGNYDEVPQLSEYPGVSLVVPCFNESKNVEETIAYLDDQIYPNFEIIAVNDGSSDDTGEILDKLGKKYSRLRVIHLEGNQGKAMALRIATLLSPNEFLVCIDGDALLDNHATTWMMSHFLNGPRVGAVTGNPRIRTRSTLLGKIQVGEFSSIIGMIKRAQRIYGRIFTVSGVVAGFRKSALHQVGYWGLDMVTEDIDISWKLQLNHWDVRFEANALCWILMPETFKGLWHQRLRWSQGGIECLIKYFRYFFSWRKRRMWGVYIEYFISICWGYLMAFFFLVFLADQFITLPEGIQPPSLIPAWHGIILGVTCLLQFAISLAIDARYEKGIGKYYYWMIWYPMAFWILNVFTTVVAVPKALLKKRGERATWVSPDRGIL